MSFAFFIISSFIKTHNVGKKVFSLKYQLRLIPTNYIKNFYNYDKSMTCKKFVAFLVANTSKVGKIAGFFKIRSPFFSGQFRLSQLS